MRMWLAIGLAVLVLIAALAAEERSGLLSAGDRAPNFTARLHDGTTVNLADILSRQAVVLFFYPKDFTSGCTKEVCAFRDRYDRLKTFNAAIFGVSGDDDLSHASFASRYRIPYPLISDTDGSIRRAYGALRLGGLVPFAKRVTYVIGRDGVIHLVSHHEIGIDEHVDEVFAVLERWQDN